MEDKLISAAKLYEVESLLMTDTVKASKEASNLLNQVLFDITHAPAVFSNTEFKKWLKVMTDDAKDEWYKFDDEVAFGEYQAFTSVLDYLRSHEVIK